MLDINTIFAVTCIFLYHVIEWFLWYAPSWVYLSLIAFWAFSAPLRIYYNRIVQLISWLSYPYNLARDRGGNIKDLSEEVTGLANDWHRAWFVLAQPAVGVSLDEILNKFQRMWMVLLQPSVPLILEELVTARQNFTGTWTGFLRQTRPLRPYARVRRPLVRMILLGNKVLDALSTAFGVLSAAFGVLSATFGMLRASVAQLWDFLRRIRVKPDRVDDGAAHVAPQADVEAEEEPQRAEDEEMSPLLREYLEQEAELRELGYDKNNVSRGHEPDPFLGDFMARSAMNQEIGRFQAISISSDSPEPPDAVAQQGNYNPASPVSEDAPPVEDDENSQEVVQEDTSAPLPLSSTLPHTSSMQSSYKTADSSPRRSSDSDSEKPKVFLSPGRTVSSPLVVPSPTLAAAEKPRQDSPTPSSEDLMSFSPEKLPKTSPVILPQSPTQAVPEQPLEAVPQASIGAQSGQPVESVHESAVEELQEQVAEPVPVEPLGESSEQVPDALPKRSLEAPSTPYAEVEKDNAAAAAETVRTGTPENFYEPLEHESSMGQISPTEQVLSLRRKRRVRFSDQPEVFSDQKPESTESSEAPGIVPPEQQQVKEPAYEGQDGESRAISTGHESQTDEPVPQPTTDLNEPGTQNIDPVIASTPPLKKRSLDHSQLDQSSSQQEAAGQTARTESTPEGRLPKRRYGSETPPIVSAVPEHGVRKMLLDRDRRRLSSVGSRSRSPRNRRSDAADQRLSPLRGSFMPTPTTPTTARVSPLQEPGQRAEQDSLNYQQNIEGDTDMTAVQPGALPSAQEETESSVQVEAVSQTQQQGPRQYETHMHIDDPDEHMSSPSKEATGNVEPVQPTKEAAQSQKVDPPTKKLSKLSLDDPPVRPPTKKLSKLTLDDPPVHAPTRELSNLSLNDPTEIRPPVRPLPSQPSQPVRPVQPVQPTQKTILPQAVDEPVEMASASNSVDTFETDQSMDDAGDVTIVQPAGGNVQFEVLDTPIEMSSDPNFIAPVVPVQHQQLNLPLIGPVQPAGGNVQSEVVDTPIEMSSDPDFTAPFVPVQSQQLDLPFTGPVQPASATSQVQSGGPEMPLQPAAHEGSGTAQPQQLSQLLFAPLQPVGENLQAQGEAAQFQVPFNPDLPAPSFALNPDALDGNFEDFLNLTFRRSFLSDPDLENYVFDNSNTEDAAFTYPSPPERAPPEPFLAYGSLQEDDSDDESESSDVEGTRLPENPTLADYARVLRPGTGPVDDDGSEQPAEEGFQIQSEGTAMAVDAPLYDPLGILPSSRESEGNANTAQPTGQGSQLRVQETERPLNPPSSNPHGTVEGPQLHQGNAGTVQPGEARFDFLSRGPAMPLHPDIRNAAEAAEAAQTPAVPNTAFLNPFASFQTSQEDASGVAQSEVQVFQSLMEQTIEGMEELIDPALFDPNAPAATIACQSYGSTSTDIQPSQSMDWGQGFSFVDTRPGDTPTNSRLFQRETQSAAPDAGDFTATAQPAATEDQAETPQRTSPPRQLPAEESEIPSGAAAPLEAEPTEAGQEQQVMSGNLDAEENAPQGTPVEAASLADNSSGRQVEAGSAASSHSIVSLRPPGNYSNLPSGPPSNYSTFGSRSEAAVSFGGSAAPTWGAAQQAEEEAQKQTEEAQKRLSQRSLKRSSGQASDSSPEDSPATRRKFSHDYTGGDQSEAAQRSLFQNVLKRRSRQASDSPPEMSPATRMKFWHDFGEGEQTVSGRSSASFPGVIGSTPQTTQPPQASSAEPEEEVDLYSAFQEPVTEPEEDVDLYSDDRMPVESSRDANPQGQQSEPSQEAPAPRQDKGKGKAVHRKPPPLFLRPRSTDKKGSPSRSGPSASSQSPGPGPGKTAPSAYTSPSSTPGVNLFGDKPRPLSIISGQTGEDIMKRQGEERKKAEEEERQRREEQEKQRREEEDRRRQEEQE